MAGRIRQVVSIAKCNGCGFVYKYHEKPAKIRCKSCGSNKSLSVRSGKPVLVLLRICLGSIDYFYNWYRIA